MNVVIIDYGLGNLLSVHNALKALGIQACISSDPAGLRQADAAILPGVGAFEDGMKGLKEKALIGPVRAFVKTGRPFLGICLGAQMLLDRSWEFGEHQGLGLIPGEVSALKGSLPADLRVPYIGWNGLRHAALPWEGTILEGMSEGQEMYFVHSFYLNPVDQKHALACAQYGPKRFCAVLAKDNVYGCQFHPEKSAAMGLRVLNNFVSLAKGSACRP